MVANEAAQGPAQSSEGKSTSQDAIREESVPEGGTMANSAVDFAKQSEKLSHQQPEEGKADDVAIEAQFVTPHDPVIVYVILESFIVPLGNVSCAAHETLPEPEIILTQRSIEHRRGIDYPGCHWLKPISSTSSRMRSTTMAPLSLYGLMRSKQRRPRRRLRP